MTSEYHGELITRVAKQLEKELPPDPPGEQRNMLTATGKVWTLQLLDEHGTVLATHEVDAQSTFTKSMTFTWTLELT